MLKLVKDNSGVISISGDYKYSSWKRTTIEVSGEIFHNDKLVESTANFDTEAQAEWNGEPEFINIEIKPLGLTYMAKRYKNFYDSIYSKTCKFIPSENYRVAIYQTLFSNGFLDSRIINLCAGKKEISYRTLIYSIFENNSNKIDLTLFGYGFNNTVSITISMSDFMLIEDKKNKIFDAELYQKVFKEYLNIDIFTSNELEFATALMNFKIKNKPKRKKQWTN